MALPGVPFIALSAHGMLERYAESFWMGAPWLLGAAIFLLLFGVAIRVTIPEPLARRLGIGLLVVIIGAAIAYGWRLRWLCDDAFISFRYADNWANGHGLVYNVGERVEGYTNFLWTALLTVGVLLGAGPGHLSLVLSLGCFGATIVFCDRLARRLLPEGARFPGMLCGAGLAANYVFASFATSGLETMAATLCVLVAVERAEAGAVLAAGVAAILATMLHPDHAIFYAALGLVIALARESRVRRIALYSAPFVGLFVPYFLARWAYYDDFFPNTYYAKSGGSHYFSQGFVYLNMSALVSGMYVVLPLAIYGLVLSRRTTFARFVVVVTPLYLGYVAKIGGDFMLGRLLCSILPFVFLAAELGVRGLLQRPKPVLGAIGLLLLAPVALPNGLVKPGEKYLKIADERTFYPIKRLSPITVDTTYTNQAKKLRRIFRDAPRSPTLAVGAIGILGYVSGYPIWDTLALVNPEVARMKIRSRGRPGHEKVATPGQILASSADITDLLPWPADYGKWADLPVGDATYWLVKYDPRLMKSVRKDETKVPNIEARIEDYEATGRGTNKRWCDLWFFDQIYFSHQRNDRLRARLGASVARADASLAGFHELLVGALPEGGGWQKKLLFSFDDLRSWTKTGDAFASGPAEQEVVGQSIVVGSRGRFVNSYGKSRGDGPQGMLRSPKFRLSGDALTVWIGGGQSPRVGVRLLVGDDVVASATGCDTEVLGRRVFSTAAFRGSDAQFEIMDEGSQGWDHVVVDEVVEWTRPR